MHIVIRHPRSKHAPNQCHIAKLSKQTISIYGMPDMCFFWIHTSYTWTYIYIYICTHTHMQFIHTWSPYEGHGCKPQSCWKLSYDFSFKFPHGLVKVKILPIQKWDGLGLFGRWSGLNLMVFGAEVDQISCWLIKCFLMGVFTSKNGRIPPLTR